MSNSLPAIFPPGTKFHKLRDSALAEFPNGEFMSPDSNVISGPIAESVRLEILDCGEPITEKEFRVMAPPTWLDKLRAIDERAQRDPEFLEKLRQSISPKDLEDSERICLDALNDKNADPEVKAEARKLLLQIRSRSQNLGGQ